MGGRDGWASYLAFLVRLGFIFGLCVAGPAVVQAQTWTKVIAATSASVYGRAVAVDSSSNVYFAGYFDASSLTVGSTTLTRASSSFDGVVVKLDSTGSVVWAKSFGESGVTTTLYSVAVDSSGNVYVAGQFSGGNHTTLGLTKIGNSDAFVIKLNSSGTVVWAQNSGGTGANVNGRHVAVDSSGNVFTSGTMSASLSTPSLTLTGTSDTFTIKYNSSGTAQWWVNYGATGASYTDTGLAVDSTGRAIVAGYFSGGTGMLGTEDAWVRQLDGSSGSANWTVTFGGSGATTRSNSSDNSNDLAVDSTGNIYFGGAFTGADLTTPALTKIGTQDALAIKLNSSGSVVWSKNFGGSGATASINGIQVDSSGNVFVGGYASGGDLTNPSLTRIGTSFNADLWWLKLNSSGTNVVSHRYGGANSNNRIFSATADSSGNVYIGGYFEGSSMTSPVVTSVGLRNGLILKDASLRTLSLTSSNGTVSSSPSGISCGSTCSAQFTDSVSVTLTAVASSGYQFGGWSGDCSGSTSPLSVTMSTDKSCTATFNSQSVTVSVTKSGDGSGTVTSNGSMDCGSTCSESVTYNGSLTLTATADSGSTFGGWSGDCSGVGTASLSSLTSSKSCTASFTLNSSATNTVEQPAEGTNTDDAPSGEVAVSTGPTDTGEQGENNGNNTTPTDTITVDLSKTFSEPAKLTFSVTEQGGDGLPTWLHFDPLTALFTGVPPDDGVPAADKRNQARDRKLLRSEPPLAADAIRANTVLPPDRITNKVPVLLKATDSKGKTTTLKFTIVTRAKRAAVSLTAVSVDDWGRAGNGASGKPALSGDGRQVIFHTGSNNIITTAAANIATDVVRYSTTGGGLDRQSMSAVPGYGLNAAANAAALNPAVSPDGSTFAFAADATNLTFGIVNGKRQVYRTDSSYPKRAGSKSLPVLVSASSTGLAGDGNSDNPSVANGGSFVAFDSLAKNLVAGVTAGTRQVYRASSSTGAMVLVSAAQDGTPGNAPSWGASISRDGNLVAFVSQATNLIAGVTGTQAYLKNLTTGSISVLSASASGSAGSGTVSSVSLARDGTAAAFAATGSNLLATATSNGGVSQVYWKSIKSGTVKLVSVNTGGIGGNGASTAPAIDASGYFVAFLSSASDLIAAVSPNKDQVYVRDTMAGITALVSAASTGAPGDGHAYEPAIAGDGSAIAFGSQATNLTAATATASQVYLAANPLALLVETGAWYDPTRSGTAYLIDRQGDVVMLGILTYANDGSPTWVLGTCALSGTSCAGTLNAYQGPGTLANPVAGATVLGAAGTFSLKFGASVTVTINGASAQTLQRYALSSTTVRTTGAAVPQSGYWIIKDETGTGWFLDIQSSASNTGDVFFAPLVYGAAGQPNWVAATGKTNTTTLFEGSFVSYRGGPTLAGGGGVPVATTAVGTVSLTFNSDDTMTLTLSAGVRKTLVRYQP